MAPEQALNAPVGPQADLYALAVILYELLTGGPLFADESAFDYITAHVHKVPQWPSRGGQALSGPLVELIVRCLAKDPFERPPSARAALAWLEAMNRATARPTVRALAAVDASATPEVDAEIIWADEGDDSPSLSVPYQIGVVDPAATEVSREPLRMGGGYAWWEIALLGLAAGIAFFIGLRFFSDGSPKGDVVASVQPAPRLAVAEVDAPGGGAWVAVETLGSPSLSVPYQIGVAGTLPAGMASVWLGSDRLGITPLEVRWPAAFEAPVLNVQLGDWQGDVDLGAPGTGPVVLRFATHRGGPQRSVE